MITLKRLLFISLVVLTMSANVNAQGSDSVSVRIYNQGKHYLKSYTIVLGSDKFTFNDIAKHKYSAYQKLPYIYSNHWKDVQVVRKRFLQYDEWMHVLSIPIDYIGEKKFTQGAVIIVVSTKKKKGEFFIKTTTTTE